MRGEIAYQYPIFIFLAVGVAIGIFVLLLKLVSKPEKKALWRCLLCGAEFSGSKEDKFKYCPYCGAKRGTRIGPRREEKPEPVDDDYADIDEDLLR